MMRNEKKERFTTTFAALLVLAVFALGILGVLLGGAGAYRRLVCRDENTADRRCCSQYLATKIRQAPLPGAVEVRPFGDGDALWIPEGEGVLTWVYCYEGWLMELCCFENSRLVPGDGEKILPLRAFSASLTQGVLELTVTDGAGVVWPLVLALRSGEVTGR